MAKETKPEKLVRLMRATQTGDGATTAELMHPEMTIHEPDSMPYAGVWSGFAALGELQKKMSAVWDEFKIDEEHTVIGDPDGDVFAVLYNITYRSVKTGRRIVMPVFEMISFRDGKVADIKPFHWDTKALLDLCVP